MYTPQVTVIPADGTIIVDGVPLCFPFAAPPDVHALQWKNGTGHIEYTTGAINKVLLEGDYTTVVLPFVWLWEAEKNRTEEEERRREEDAKRPPTLEEARAAALARVSAEMESAILGGFNYTVAGMVYHFSYDLVDQGNFTKAALAAALAQMQGETAWRQPWRGWLAAAGGQAVPRVLSFDAAAFLALALYAGKEHQEKCMAEGWVRQEAVLAAQSVEELGRV